MNTPDHNLSTDHQPKGAALNPSDTLDREGEQVPAGQRRWNDDSAEKPAETQPSADPGPNL